MQPKIQVDIIKKDMVMTIKQFLIPIISSAIFMLLYYLFPKVNMGIWLFFIATFGIWFSILLVKIIQYHSVTNSSNVIGFVIAGTFLFFLTIAYLSKNYSLLLDFRRVTFLPFNGLVYLLLLYLFFSFKINIYDVVLVIAYGLTINYIFTDGAYNTFKRLDLLIASWIFCFTTHLVIMLRR